MAENILAIRRGSKRQLPSRIGHGDIRRLLGRCLAAGLARRGGVGSHPSERGPGGQERRRRHGRRIRRHRGSRQQRSLSLPVRRATRSHRRLRHRLTWWCSANGRRLWGRRRFEDVIRLHRHGIWRWLKRRLRLRRGHLLRSRLRHTQWLSPVRIHGQTLLQFGLFG